LTCPVCDIAIKPPGDLFIDAFLVQILGETGPLDEEVAFDNVGGWTVSAVAASPASDSEDGATAPPPAQMDADDSTTWRWWKAMLISKIPM
jgi:hypothetical protein